MVRALDVAKYLIHLATPREDEDSDCLCHMRLQKLLYYVQSWHLAAMGVPCFPERIEAWKHGPVVRPLYPVFADYRLAIPPTLGADSNSLGLTETAKDFIRSIWGIYKGYSATALRDMTHREAPWVDARGDLPDDAPSDKEITAGAMRAYFLPRYVELLKRKDSRIDVGAWVASSEAIASGQVRAAKDILRDLRDRRTPTGPR